MDETDVQSHTSITVKGLNESNLSGRILTLNDDHLHFSANRHVPRGEFVELEVFLSHDDPFPIRLKGTSIWSSHLDGCPIVVNLDISASHSRNLGVLSNFMQKNC